MSACVPRNFGTLGAGYDKLTALDSHSNAYLKLCLLGKRVTLIINLKGMKTRACGDGLHMHMTLIHVFDFHEVPANTYASSTCAIHIHAQAID